MSAKASLLGLQMGHLLGVSSRGLSSGHTYLWCLSVCPSFLFFFFFFFFFFCWPRCSIWKFQGQGWNLHHSSNRSCFSDNAGSLTCGTTRELLISPSYKGISRSGAGPTLRPHFNTVTPLKACFQI